VGRLGICRRMIPFDYGSSIIIIRAGDFLERKRGGWREDGEETGGRRDGIRIGMGR
jgi:hypothetical protein